MELSGNEIAKKIQQELKGQIEKLRSQGLKPSLAVILVGEDPASLSYVRVKEQKAEDLGIDFRLFHFAANAREDQVLDLISELNQNNRLQGIVVQLPLPKDFDTEKIISSVTPKKDVDGMLGQKNPPAVSAILAILDHYKIDLKGNIVLVGHGRLVGKPLEKVLLAKGIRPKICDSQTADLKKELSNADIIITATGVPGLIKEDMVKEEAVIIDAGTAESRGNTTGDVDPKVYQKVKAYSPVPGGVGPLTVVMLMKNLIEVTSKE